MKAMREARVYDMTVGKAGVILDIDRDILADVVGVANRFISDVRSRWVPFVPVDVRGMVKLVEGVDLAQRGWIKVPDGFECKELPVYEPVLHVLPGGWIRVQGYTDGSVLWETDIHPTVELLDLLMGGEEDE